MKSLIDWLSQNKDVVQAFSSLLVILVGFLSIMLTVLTLRTNRRHNQLSVKPIADISASDFENKLSVTLDNRGNGPLIIQAFRAVKNGVSKSSLIDWMPDLPPGLFWTNFTKNIEGCALRPSESIPLIEFSLDMKNRTHREARDLIRRALADITLELDYRDIYDNPFKFPQHSLSWFGRHFNKG